MHCKLNFFPNCKKVTNCMSIQNTNNNNKRKIFFRDTADNIANILQ